MNAGEGKRAQRGRGAVSNPAGRFQRHVVEAVPGAPHDDDGVSPTATQVQAERARRIISRNQSPDVPFEQSINPYRGCEHGCIYCYARPSHAYLDLSPGLDFETRLFFKDNAAALLEDELRRPGYRCRPITLGANTDPYQPIERELRVTRSVLEVLHRSAHPCSLITKGALIERDLDLLADMARRRLVTVMISVTTLDDELKRIMEPRAAAPARRLRAIERLTAAGVPTGVLVAPVIPAVNDGELEAIVARCAAAGARSAGYVVLRLPHELKGLFGDWLEEHFPQRAERVRSLLRQLHGGREYDPSYGRRQSGSGPVARLLAQRFAAACRRAGIDGARRPGELDAAAFRPPPPAGQLSLWS